MKRNSVVFLLLILFLTGCSYEEYPVKDDNTGELLTDGIIFEESCSEVPSDVKSEELQVKTHYMNRKNNKIFSFDSRIFIRNTEYCYRNDRYYLTGNKLTDYIPQEDRETILDEIDHLVWPNLFQIGDTIIYTTQDETGEYRVKIVDFPSGGIRCSFVIQGEIECVYENKLYYKTIQQGENGSEVYSLKYLNVNDLSPHILYSTKNWISQVMVRDDGEIAFAVDNEGYYVVDTENNIKLLHESIDGLKYYIKEQFYRFDNTGLYFFAEYFNQESELIYITDGGDLFRIRLYYDNIDNEIALPQGMLVYNKTTAKLYPYQYEVTEIEEIPAMRFEFNMPDAIQDYVLLDSQYWEKGYRLYTYFYQNNNIWWLWMDDDNNLIISCTEIVE